MCCLILLLIFFLLYDVLALDSNSILFKNTAILAVSVITSLEMSDFTIGLSVVYFNFHNKILCRLLIGWLIVASSIVSIYLHFVKNSLCLFLNHFILLTQTKSVRPSVPFHQMIDL